MASEILDMIHKRNQEEAVQHELRRQAALKKVQELRRAQREQEELKHKEKLYEHDIPQRIY